MAAPRVLGIKINKLSITMTELENRVETLEGLVETLTVLLEAELGKTLTVEETPKSATKRRPRKKAS